MSDGFTTFSHLGGGPGGFQLIQQLLFTFSVHTYLGLFDKQKETDGVRRRILRHAMFQNSLLRCSPTDSRR